MPIVAVLDTNVWVSAFLNPVGHPARLIAAGKARQFELITSRPLLEELYDVLCRPRIMKIRGTSANDAQTFVQLIAAVARLVPVDETLGVCRDPDDDVLLGTALAGTATHVVSRDEDVTRDLELAKLFELRGIKLVTVSRFLSLLKIQPADL